MITDRREMVWSYVVLSAFSVAAVAPIVGIVLVALRPDGVIGGQLSFPGGLDLANFGEAWSTGRFGSSLWASAQVVAVVVPSAALLSIFAGYSFGTMSYPGRDLIFMFFLFGLIVPQEATITPLFYTMRSLGMTNRLGALILPQIATLLAFGSFWMRAFFRAVPPELIDAAQVDGAGHWRVLWRVLLPISWPHVSAMMVLMFMWTWNDFLLALVMVVNESVRTAPLSLTFFVGRFQADFTLIAAGALLVAAPVILFYVVFQRQFVHGVTGGAVKE